MEVESYVETGAGGSQWVAPRRDPTPSAYVRVCSCSSCDVRVPFDKNVFLGKMFSFCSLVRRLFYIKPCDSLKSLFETELPAAFKYIYNLCPLTLDSNFLISNEELLDHKDSQEWREKI